MKFRTILIVAVLTLALSACTLSLASDITPPPNYQSPTPGPTMSPLFPQASPNLASGAALFLENCAPCHGEKGLGDGPMKAGLQSAPAAIGKPELGRISAPANWYTKVTEGNVNSSMPAFNGLLSDQQRWDVVAYAMSLAGSTPGEAEKGKAVYQNNCVNCHGATGNTYPKADFSNQSMMAKLTQQDIYNFVDKGVGAMPGLGGLLAEADIYAVASYVRTFSVKAGEAAAMVSATPQTAAAASTPEPLSGTPAPTLEAGVTATVVVPVGTVAGTVVNGGGAAIPSGLTVVLHVFEHDTATQKFSEVTTQATPLNVDGTYKFTNVSMPANHAFFVSVEYSNANYESDPAFPKDGNTNIDLPLTIYDTTTDTSGLVAEQAHILLDYSKGNVVQIVELLTISNPGAKSIVAAEVGGPVLKISLPKGYSNLQFEQGAIGDRYLKTEDGFADTTSVSPGTKKYQLVFAVDLPQAKAGLFGGQSFEFSQMFPFKVSGLSVFVPEGVTVEGKGFTIGDVQDFGSGTKYQVFTGTDIEAGKNLDVKATGSPKGISQPEAGANTVPNIIFGVGAFGLVLILVGVWMYLRDRYQKNSDAESDADGDDEEMSKDEIIDAIVALDDQFKAGNIQEIAYKERRAELKDKLTKSAAL